LSELSGIHTTRVERIVRAELAVQTSGEGFFEITREVAQFLEQVKARDGVVLLYLQHTSASLVIQENADPDVRHDLADFFRRLVPEDGRLYRHDAEGPDDMPAHIRSALTQTQLAIPVEDGRLALGTWQGIYLFEHRRAPHRRSLVLTLIGG
jgi:secondary thiamine-phosphate synthase enzyme